MSNNLYYKKPGSNNSSAQDDNRVKQAAPASQAGPAYVNNGANTVRPKEKKYRFLNVIIVVMTVILFFMVLGVIISTRPRGGNFYDKSSASDLLRRMNYSGYYRMVESKYENEVQGVTADKEPELEVPYAISDYYLAAFCYRGYKGAGAPEADDYRLKMDEAKARMGEYAYIADDIDEYIGIK